MNLTRRDCPLRNDGQHPRNPEGHSRDHHEQGPSRTERILHHAKRPSISLGSLELAAACHGCSGRASARSLVPPIRLAYE
eukprot:2136432-Amphidinium_carterae.2